MEFDTHQRSPIHNNSLFYLSSSRNLLLLHDLDREVEKAHKKCIVMPSTGETKQRSLDETKEPQPKRMRPTKMTSEVLLVLKQGCETFLEHKFGLDLVNPMMDMIIPRPKDRKELIEKVDEWVDDPDSFGVLGHIGLWNTSQVTDFSSIFNGWRNPKLLDFDEDLGLWDLSNATTTERMLHCCMKFKGLGLSQWNVRNVTNMREMFYYCNPFVGDLSGWDTSSVTNMSGMFYCCSSFNGDLSGWDTSSVTYMRCMFHNCSSFNKDSLGWDTSSAIDKSYM